MTFYLSWFCGLTGQCVCWSCHLLLILIGSPGGWVSLGSFFACQAARWPSTGAPLTRGRVVLSRSMVSHVPELCHMAPFSSKMAWTSFQYGSCVPSAMSTEPLGSGTAIYLLPSAIQASHRASAESKGRNLLCLLVRSAKNSWPSYRTPQCFTVLPSN